MRDIVDAHDATLDVKLSAAMKVELIDAHLSLSSQQGDHRRIVMWHALIRYLDDAGINSKTQQRLTRGLQQKLRTDLMACGQLQPESDLPCIGQYINYIAASNADFRSQLHDQFQSCMSDKLPDTRVCKACGSASVAQKEVISS